MPLNCDCFPGCWGKHSESWPKLYYVSQAALKEAWQWIVANPDAVPYGAYVVGSAHIRLEKQEYIDRVRNGVKEAKSLQKWVPTTDIAQLRVLGKAGEEAGELVSALSRCIIQGLDGTEPVSGKPNKQWLEEEIADVQATIAMLKQELNLDTIAIAERDLMKRCKLEEWRKLLEE